MPQRTFLVIGSGGREHALAWKLSQGDDEPVVYVAPGNDGIAADETIRGGCVDIGAGDFEALAEFVEEKGVDLTVVGPEAPLCDGVADFFDERGLAVFGPKKAAAELEGSKSFAKAIMTGAGVPTAEYDTFDDMEAAISYVRRVDHPVVIKADGLAGGKGVVISPDVDTSVETLESYMAHEEFGEASQRVLIEEFLEGTEMSFMVVTDGEHVVPLSTSQDHKRVGEGDTGPNTGGMGAFTPSHLASPELQAKVIEEVIRPTLDELRAQNIPYSGFLYAGLMLTEAGPKVLEFNCRMGDPETQPLMYAMDADLGDVLLEAATGGLTGEEALASDAHAYCVVLASKGYPGPRDTGYVIEGLDEAAEVDGTKVFHAGTKRGDDGHFRNTGGRVLGVTARGATREEARERVYEAVSKISWEGMHYRGDIGKLD
ncbi:phosphoribosylamine--glycine ligase [Persicimonas caeni]|uniref:Phosphoribosylamine--glycine ligase n=1 Tax=Persicimonas caeni TaxID=2292766 RepID=A0A4Y6PYE4_PERCE|nr:phosphoribosylamine--glycine ligase [Persicimonas caeni]QDG53331.1 phosphoribosylamine--glycine ligase [Persicimonas caeni]QED34552.1 phosphoribosylamine--glycine ligase [Persicimonas caeni]